MTKRLQFYVGYFAANGHVAAEYCEAEVTEFSPGEFVIDPLIPPDFNRIDEWAFDDAAIEAYKETNAT